MTLFLPLTLSSYSFSFSFSFSLFLSLFLIPPSLSSLFLSLSLSLSHSSFSFLPAAAVAAERRMLDLLRQRDPGGRWQHTHFLRSMGELFVFLAAHTLPAPLGPLLDISSCLHCLYELEFVGRVAFPRKHTDHTGHFIVRGVRGSKSSWVEWLAKRPH